MSYPYQCPDCGAYLDPGERCDCRDHPDTDMPDKTKKAAMPASTAANPHRNGDIR